MPRRFLPMAFCRPTTITRQSYAILDSSRQVLANTTLRTLYDPVARVVTIAGPDGLAPWLTPGQSYYLVLATPTDPTSPPHEVEPTVPAPSGASPFASWTSRTDPVV